MKAIKIMITIMCLCGASSKANAQAEELQQLALNIEKLAQFKQILSDLKKGYEIVSKGYGTVRDISQGNFNLHKTFLDGLYIVSPEVRKYRRAAQIVNYQLALVKEYKVAYSRFKNNRLFDTQEIAYLASVYKRLFDGSMRNIEELTMIMTSGKLRMSDDERLKAIDGIYEDMEDKVMFLRYFNNQTTTLALQREKQQQDVEFMREISGVKK